VKILLADDHALFRGGLAQVLQQLNEHVEILEASTVDEFLTLVNEHHDLDLVLLDLNMPGKNGFEAMRLLCSEERSIPTVIISASDNPADITRSRTLGAMGFIGKHSNSEIVLNALRLVLAGEPYFPASTNFNFAAPKAKLTRRQIDVLHLMDQGMSNKDIAIRLDITEATVKMHVSAIFKELGVNNRTQAVITANSLGIT